MEMSHSKSVMPDQSRALPGRSDAMDVSNLHFVLHNPIKPPFPEQCESIVVGMGCFWGAEKAFWNLPGVYTTAVGYSAGITPNPTYKEVCSGMTGHNEVVLIVYDPSQTSLSELLKIFWESHDPTQGMRQGNDRGTQYRSGVYVNSAEQKRLAEESKLAYQEGLAAGGFGEITTEVIEVGEFYYAEEYHQQYLAKNPAGYCGLGGTGIGLLK